MVIEFARSLPGPLWTATCDDADRWLAELRRAGRSVSTRAGKAGTLGGFYDVMVARYQGDIYALTDVVVEQPIDAFNRQADASLGQVRVPPTDAEVEELFAGWRSAVRVGVLQTDPGTSRGPGPDPGLAGVEQGDAAVLGDGLVDRVDVAVVGEEGPGCWGGT